MSRKTRHRVRVGRRRHGFTLLEVLAAVAILGILFTVLSAVAITGFRAEGINLRRLRASLIADRRLNELEAPMLAELYPEVSSDETEEGEFLVQVDVKPLAEAGDSDLVSFLEEQVPDLMPLLSAVEVRVSWSEGSEELEIRRTTHVFDRAAWADAFGRTEETGELPDFPSEEAMR